MQLRESSLPWCSCSYTRPPSYKAIVEETLCHYSTFFFYIGLTVMKPWRCRLHFIPLGKGFACFNAHHSHPAQLKTLRRALEEALVGVSRRAGFDVVSSRHELLFNGQHVVHKLRASRARRFDLKLRVVPRWYFICFLKRRLEWIPISSFWGNLKIKAKVWID